MTVDDEPEILTLPQWNFYAANGCRAQSGTYTVIAELPEHGMVTTQHIEYTSMDINPCGDVNTADMDAVLSWLDETTVSVETSMSSEGQDYLRISQPCTFEVEFVNLDDEVVHRFQTLCDAYDGRKILLPSSTAPLRFDTLDISLVQDGTALLPDGQYTLELTAMSTTIATASMPLTWPQDFAETTTEEEPTQTVTEPFELTGTWTGLPPMAAPVLCLRMRATCTFCPMQEHSHRGHPAKCKVSTSSKRLHHRLVQTSSLLRLRWLRFVWSSPRRR